MGVQMPGHPAGLHVVRNLIQGFETTPKIGSRFLLFAITPFAEMEGCQDRRVAKIALKT